MSKKGYCYNNAAFNNERSAVVEPFNNLMEIAAYQAYNETFVDDNGFEIGGEESYVDFQKDRYQPQCRRSIALSPTRRSGSGRPLPRIVAFHKDDAEIPRRYNRYESICSADDRFFEEMEAANEEYVDYPEDRMGVARPGFPVRESPLGCSGTIRHAESTVRTPDSTPRKSSVLRSSPGGRSISRHNSIVLAPILAQMERKQQIEASIRRSRSTILASPHRHAVKRLSREASSPVDYNIRKSMPSLVPVRHCQPATRLQSFNYIVESDMVDTVSQLGRTPNRKPNTAVITPNFRSSAAPLLPGSGGKAECITPTSVVPSPPPKSPSTYSRASWMSLPTVHLPIEMLCCIGFLLLLAGSASCILCFYLLSMTGRKYFLNFGAVSGFMSLVLGLLSCRTNKWKWLPHRNYLTGYLLLSLFSLANACCLGGILYAAETKQAAIVDIMGGVVCLLCIVVCIGSLLGLITSGCCHRPPPDNRVAHKVNGFTV